MEQAKLKQMLDYDAKLGNLVWRKEEAADAYRQAAKELYGDFYDDAQAPTGLHNSIRGVY